MFRSVAGFFIFSAVISAATITVQPDSIAVNAGQSFTLNVAVANVTDLYAFQFDLTFSPTLLAATGVTEGALFSGVGVGFYPGTIDNASGRITMVLDALSGPGPGITGSGSLATVAMNAIAQGTGTVGLSDVILLDSALQDTAVDTTAASVTVRETAIPEPSGLLLLPVALIVLATGAARGFRSE